MTGSYYFQPFRALWYSHPLRHDDSLVSVEVRAVTNGNALIVFLQSGEHADPYGSGVHYHREGELHEVPLSSLTVEVS